MKLCDFLSGYNINVSRNTNLAMLINVKLTSSFQHNSFVFRLKKVLNNELYKLCTANKTKLQFYIFT